ncbi:MAG: hypothetical protein AABX63_03930, partial [Nanoarchaeota archaeon]
MRKTGVLLILAVLLLIPIVVYSQGASTGVGLTILDTQGPVVNLIEPLNNSGRSNRNITFLYNVSDDSSVADCSLIVRNKINITDNTIVKNTKISFVLNNTAVGGYNWSINCTDNLGFNGSSEDRIFFLVSMPTKPSEAISNETIFNGTTTNLSSVNITNITNFVTEVTGFGKINFSDSVDLSQALNLGNFINMTSNKIELDSNTLRELNKSATLYLYGLTFTNPRVVRDGIVCPSSVCTEVSYSGGTFAFNVTHFTTYSSEETPGGGGSGSSGGGGGGEGGGRGGGGSGPVA